MGLKELFALFEEMQKLNEVTTVGILPTVGASEKEYEKEHQSITTFYETLQKVLGDIISKTKNNKSHEKIIKLIEYVELIKQQKIPTTHFSKTFATMLFVTSLHKMIEDLFPDTPSVAGFSFEKFIAFFLSGKASITTKTDRYPIYDIYIPQTEEYLSLKLKKVVELEGSISNMYKFLTNTQESLVPININNIKSSRKITYVVGIKETHKVLFYTYTFGIEEFIQMLGPKLELYNIYVLKGTKLRELSSQYDEARAEIDRLESATQQKDYEKIRELEDYSRKVMDEIRRIENIKEATSFTFGKKILDATNGIERELTGIELSISADDKNNIIKNNQNIFNKNIKDIIEESNLVYYKVNNFLLTQGAETAANEAYDSVKKLETSLSSYIPKQKQTEEDPRQTKLF
jgi:hypothetical protein